MSNPYFDLVRSVWQHGKSWRHIIIGYYVMQALAQICLSFNPYIFGRTIDTLQNFSAGRLWEVIFWLGAGFTTLFLYSALHGPARIQERYVALKIQQKFKIGLYEKITQLPLKWHQEHHSGNTISRINRATRALYMFAVDQFIYIQIIIKFFISVSFLLWISIPFGICCILTCTVAIAIVILFDRKLIPVYDEQNEIDNRVSGILFDYVSNMTTVLTLSLRKLTASNLYQRMISVWPFYRKDVILNEVKWFSIGMLLTSMQSIMLISYIIYTLNTTGTIMIGVVIILFRYQGELNDVFYSVSSLYSQVVHLDRDIKGLQPILDDIEKYSNKRLDRNLPHDWQKIEISDLSFQHEQNIHHREIFKNINFTIKRGEKIALIGLSGSGKSTLLNLLCGLYTANHVNIKIGDLNFKNLEPLKNITTLIPQDPEIFENTLAFNINLDLQSEAAAVNKAVELSKFSSVLATLPLGLDTDIREKGLNFSVGQKQRLALARGLFAARFSSLILMDEPTSSVDLPTEKEILSGVLTEFSKSTIIVSLHRLHLLPKFDRVIMLDNGKIIADGPTASLLQSHGPVHDLWQAYHSNELVTA